jgi:Transposase IS66 family
LAEHPDITIEATLDACPHCQHTLGPADHPRSMPTTTSTCRRSVRSSPGSTTIVAFRCDRSRKIETPTSWRLPVLPQAGDCPGAGGVGTRLAVRTRHQLADPASAHPLLCLSTCYAGGTLGGVAQAVSFQRLSRLMDAVFGLTISEGAIANILLRAEAPLLAATAPIAAAVRASPVVGSDETSAQVRGKTWWQGGAAEHKRNLPRHRRYAGRLRRDHIP